MACIARPDVGVLRPVNTIGASGHPEPCPVKGYNSSIFMGAINRRSLSLGPVAEHTRALVAYVVVVGSPLTHSSLIVFIRLSE